MPGGRKEQCLEEAESPPGDYLGVKVILEATEQAHMNRHINIKPANQVTCKVPFFMVFLSFDHTSVVRMPAKQSGFGSQMISSLLSAHVLSLISLVHQGFCSIKFLCLLCL